MFSMAKWIWTKEEILFPGHFVFFRRVFKLDDCYQSANLSISADSKYRLWINQNYVGTGPARGWPGAPYVDTYDVNSLLHPGDNVIAVLVQHYSNGAVFFSPIHGGLVLELQINRKPILFTDHEWKCQNADSYSVIPAGYQHLEVFNNNIYPEAWRAPEFNDVAWGKSVYVNGALTSPQNLTARPIPFLTNKIYPAKSIICLGLTINGQDIKIEDLAISLRDMKRSRIFNIESNPPVDALMKFPPDGITVSSPGVFFIEIDMGEELLGTPRFSIDTEEITVVDIGYCEVLENNLVNPFRQKIFFAERLITRPGKNDHTIFQPRGFRYLIMRFNTNKQVRIRFIEVIEEVYPVSRKGFFSSSDKALDKIFKMCQRTMNLCMEDAFTDCPWRERQQWLGDLVVEFKTALYALGAADICRKALLEFCAIKTGELWIHAVAPGGTGLNLPTFGMFFPSLVWDYYLFTGEKDILHQCYPTIKEMSDFLESISKGGLILTKNQLTRDNIWHFVDWTKTDANNSDGALQGIYLYFLRFAEKVANALKRDGEKQLFGAKAQNTERAILKAFWSEKRNAFLKYRKDGSTLPPGTPALLIGQHENFLFSLLNVGSPKQRKSALEAIEGLAGRYLPDIGGRQSYFFDDQCGSVADKEIIMLGSPFFSYFALASLYAAGKYNEALEYIKLCWGYMLDNGPGTCWEMWGGGTSLCHGFSTAPAFFIFSEILSISPQRPGFKAIKIAPRNFALKHAEGTIHLLQGALTFRWQKHKDEVKIYLGVPEQSEVFFHIPTGYKSEDNKCKNFKEGKHFLILKATKHQSSK